MLVMLRVHTVFSVSLSCQRGEALPIVAGEIFVYRSEFDFIFLAQLFEMRERGFNDFAPPTLLTMTRRVAESRCQLNRKSECN